MSSEKLKVLLVPADFYHAEGNIALNLMKSCPEIDFYLFAAHDIPKKWEEFKSLIESVDVVHFLMNLSNMNFPKGLDKDKFLKSLSCASVSTVHHICEGEEFKLNEAKKTDLIHVVSKEWFEILKNEYGQFTHLAHLGVDSEKFRLNITERPRKKFRIGMFGFFQEIDNRKRLDVLIRALTILKARNLNFEVVFQGQLFPVIQNELNRQQIPFRFLGISASSEAFETYKRIDCYVITADVEGGPFSTLEALASGVPLITTPVGMSREVIKHNENGIIVNKGDSEALAAAIFKLATEADFYKKIVEKGLIDVKLFDWKALKNEYISLYEQAVKIKAGKRNGGSFVRNNNFVGPERINKEVMRRDWLRESAFLYNFNNYSGSFKLFVKTLTSGHSNFKDYKEYFKKIISR